MKEYLRNRVVLPYAKNNRLNVPMAPLGKRRQFIAMALTKAPQQFPFAHDCALSISAVNGPMISFILFSKGLKQACRRTFAARVFCNTTTNTFAIYVIFTFLLPSDGLEEEKKNRRWVPAISRTTEIEILLHQIRWESSVWFVTKLCLWWKNSICVVIFKANIRRNMPSGRVKSVLKVFLNYKINSHLKRHCSVKSWMRMNP